MTWKFDVRITLTAPVPVSKLPGDSIMLSFATSRRVVKRAHPGPHLWRAVGLSLKRTVPKWIASAAESVAVLLMPHAWSHSAAADPPAHISSRSRIPTRSGIMWIEPAGPRTKAAPARPSSGFRAPSKTHGRTCPPIPPIHRSGARERSGFWVSDTPAKRTVRDPDSSAALAGVLCDLAR